MKYPGKGLLALAVLSVLGTVQAAAPGTVTRRAPDISKKQAAVDDARRVAAKIDEIIGAGYDKNKIRPAPLTSDSAFLRRATLDITGKIPVVNDARKFLTDRSDEKRAEAIGRLLDSPGYVNHFTNMWRDLLIPEANADFQRRYLLPSMDRWLRKHFASNTAYDKMVRELVALPIGNRNDQMMYYNFYNGATASPMTFFLAKQGKPEDIAASITRLFLGVRLECAQCHDHPFGKWTREQFWSQASFFAGLKGRGGDFFFGPLNEVQDRREMNIPNTDRVAQARFLDGKQPKWKFKIARTTLSEWMTAKGNPFFAKALVNRMWSHFFGLGIVEPVDDLVDDNKPSHPELLDMLAKEFVNHDFDLKFLIRAITLSRTYQLSSVIDPTNPTPAPARLFARMSVKGLTGEQMYDSLCVATGVRDNFSLQQRIYSFGSQRQTFTEAFSEQEKKTEYHTSIPQALTMMNNQMITEATHPDRSRLLGAIVSSSFMTDAGKIEALYLAALSRKPDSEEAEKLQRYVERGGAANNKKKALADVFWALLNSTEFKFNH